MTPTKQWRYVDLTRNSSFILFFAKVIMSYIKLFLAVSTFVETWSLAGRALLRLVKN